MEELLKARLGFSQWAPGVFFLLHLGVQRWRSWGDLASRRPHPAKPPSPLPSVLCTPPRVPPLRAHGPLVSHVAMFSLSSWGAVPVTWLWLPGDPEPPPAPDTGPEAPAEAREGRCSPTVWPSLHRSPAPVLSDRVSHRLSADWPSLGCHRQKGSCEATGTKLSCQSRQARPPPRPSVCPAAHAPQLQPPTRGPTLADLL